MAKEFNHLQSAHCENGVTTALLKHHGLDFITEPLAFGIGAGIFYIHIPFMKINNGPAISYRSMPGWIFNRTCKALKAGVKRVKFSSEAAAQKFLDDKIAEGEPVGCQVGVYNLPYFPDEYRFHFNAHNIIVYGKENGRYLVSDPVMETTTTLSEEELMKVRFAKGPLAPKGQIYFPTSVHEVDEKVIQSAIQKGIKSSVRDMIHLPFAGVAGIKSTANQVRKWREKHGQRRAGLYLGQIVRMQEEIGTGGGGFRFLYGAFLEQAHQYIKKDELLTISEQFTKAGDMWRECAVHMAGIYKGRLKDQAAFDQTADMMEAVANVEKQAFKSLSKLF